MYIVVSSSTIGKIPWGEAIVTSDLKTLEEMKKTGRFSR